LKARRVMINGLLPGLARSRLKRPKQEAVR
jgi:hypothetical protein